MSQRVQNDIEALQRQVAALEASVASLHALLQAMTRASTPKQGLAA